MPARGTGYERVLLGAILLAAPFSCMCPARGFAEGLTSGRGFGDLKWGDTVEEAMQSCPDLRFEGYRIVREKEAPFQAYSRERAANKVDGVRFDSLEYWFRGNRLLEIRAVLRSRIGPRTLVTDAERSYNVLSDRIRAAYGAPRGHTVKYVSQHLAVIKETMWTTRGVTIRLTYNGADQGDVDRLMLEMGKKGDAP